MNSPNIQDAFFVTVPANNTQPGYCNEWLEAEVASSWLINSATCDFLEGGIDEEVFLDIVEACNQDMDEYIKTANSNLAFLLNR